MIILGCAATAALGLAFAAARCPLGRALAIGMRCLDDAPHPDLRS